MTRFAIASAMMLALVAGPARAASILLTFDDVACNSSSSGGSADVGCTVSGQPVGTDYGSTTGLTVFFKPGDRLGITPDQNHVVSDFGTPRDFSAGQPGNIPPAPLGEIIFTPAPGYEVSLVSYAHLRGTNTANQAIFRVSDPDGTEVYSLDVTNLLLGKVTEAVNTAFYTGPITLSYGSTSGFTRIDDIRLELSLVAAVSLPGDYNQDGTVDAADYTVWRDNLGQSATLPNDSTPGTVTQSDYDTWRAHFGQTLGSGSGASANVAVPEPAALVLLMFAAAGWCLRRVQSA